MTDFASNPTVRDRILGCTLGGAIGDALGAGIEFWTLGEIRRRYGPDGARDFTLAYGHEAPITDDTQMTLFTIEGIIRASIRQRTKGICHGPGVVRHAYLRWLHTQGEPWSALGYVGEREPDGWLVHTPGLHAQRAPGNTCLSALRAGGEGTPSEPLNDSKGCGAVMRTAPCGFARRYGPGTFAFGCEIGALTHGHPSGYLPAGFLARTVDMLLGGSDLDEALDAAEADLVTWESHAETLEAVRSARRLGAAGQPTPEQLESLGGGWVGEEALAIAITCAVGASDFEQGVLAAVNHSGDSDSTGAIAGNLLGARWGIGCIRKDWLERLELCDVIMQLAEDVYTELWHPPVKGAWGDAPSDWYARYPGW